MDLSIIPIIIKYTDSLWAALFIFLFAWVLKSNDSREKRYLGVIEQLSEKIDVNVVEVDRKLDTLNEKIAEIRAEVNRKEK